MMLVHLLQEFRKEANHEANVVAQQHEDDEEDEDTSFRTCIKSTSEFIFNGKFIVKSSI